MGLLVDGVWHDQWYDTSKNDGKFVRSEAQFRNWITPDGEAGPSGKSGFKAEAGRYHLFAAYACPWAHRTLIYRSLKALEDMIDVSFVHWFMGDKGWTFADDEDNIVGDRLFGSEFAHQIYTRADPNYSGRVTVPILWDKQEQTIASNESSEIIRMFNSAFDAIGAKPGDYYPQAHRDRIDEINDRVYNTLDYLEGLLSENRYLVGDQTTEADWRTFPTLARFDSIYHGHFKCNIRRLSDYPNLWAYTRDLYQHPGISGTLNFAHNKQHYYASHETVNPTRIVPKGPVLDFEAPHGRD